MWFLSSILGLLWELLYHWLAHLVTKACRTDVIFSRFSREGKREASEGARHARRGKAFHARFVLSLARKTQKKKKIAPILQAIIGNYYIPLVFCRAIEEYVSKVTSRLVGWLKSAGTSSITAATMKTAKEALYKTRSNSRLWLNRFPPKPGYDEAIVHSNNWVCG